MEDLKIHHVDYLYFYVRICDMPDLLILQQVEQTGGRSSKSKQVKKDLQYDTVVHCLRNKYILCIMDYIQFHL